MTIAFRSLGTADVDNGPGSAVVNPGLPPGYQDNDILVLVVATDNASVATPSGWTLKAATARGAANASNSIAINVYWKRATGVVPSPTITDPTGPIAGYIQAVIAAYSGAKQSGDPFNAH